MSDTLVDAFAEALRLHSPAPLDLTERAALVRAAMQTAEDEALVDGFADALRAEPPAAIDASSLVQRILSAPSDEEEPSASPAVATSSSATSAPATSAPATLSPDSLASLRARYRFWVAAAVAAIVLLCVGVGLQVQVLLGGSPRQAAVAPVVHQLAGGHRITASHDARLEIAQSDARVSVSLVSGEALFDVAPGSQFQVVAGEERVLVTGTVFTVARADAQVHVRVYEGSVRVESHAGAEVLVAGDLYGDAPRNTQLHALALEAARVRSARARVSEGTREGSAGGVASARDPERDPAPALDPSPGPVSDPVPDRGPQERSAPDLDSEPRPARRTENSAASDRLAVTAARRALAARQYEEAYALLGPVVRRRPTAERRMLQGDALRGLGRVTEAMATYRLAMRGASPNQRAVAGLAAARLLAGPLARAADAHDVLVESGALQEGSPVVSAARRLDASLQTR